MKKSLKIVLPFLIVLGTTGLVSYLMKTKAASPPLQISERVWRVDTLSVASGSYSPTITLYGKIESPLLYNASAPLLSRVEQINIREGEQFEKGQLLAKLDERDFLPQLQIAEAKLAEIKAKLSTEKLKYQSNKKALQHEEKLLQLGLQALDRSRKIHQQKLGSQSETDDVQKLVEQQRLALNARKYTLDGHKARMQQLKATQNQLLAELQKARLALERASFFSPYAGIVAKLNVAAGDQLATGGQLFSIYPLKGLEIRAKIPASIKNEIRADLQQGKSLSAFIKIAGKKIELSLERLAGQASSSGIDALFSIAENNNQVRLGAIVEITLIRSAQDDLFVVPYKAIYGVDKIYKVQLDDNQEQRMQAAKMFKVGSYAAADIAQEKSLFEKLDMLVEVGEKIAIIGPNGIGKTTLIRTIVKDLEPDSGRVNFSENAQIGYYAQDHADDFAAEMTLYDWMDQWSKPEDDEQVIRGALGRLLFSKDDIGKPVKVLSGGEKGRMLLGKLMLQNPNLLFMDEPTNHMDMESIESLNMALDIYQGTLIFVSHDREFVSSLASRIIELTPDGLVDFHGSYDEYLDKQGIA